MRLKSILLALATLSCVPAMATNTPTTPAMTQSQVANGGAGGLGGSATGGAGGSAVGGGATDGDTSVYVLPAPIGGSNLPAGMCQRSKYAHFAIGWNFISKADGDSHTDMDCLRLLIELERLRSQPMPKPTVQIMTETADDIRRRRELLAELQAEAKECTPPAKAKSVVAAKAAGAKDCLRR